MEENSNKPPTAREFEINMEDKMKDIEFTGDIEALLRPEIDYNQKEAYEHIYRALIQYM